LNDIFESYDRILARIEGLDGETPEFHNDVDMKGARIRHVGHPMQNEDAQQYGLCLHADDFSGDFNAGNRAIFNTAPGTDRGRVVVFEQLQSTESRLSETLAPVDAEFIVAAADDRLSGERVATDSTTVTWDFSVADVAKANVATLDTGWSTSGVTTDKALTVGDTLAQTQDVLGTLINLLLTKNILGA
jgi:hypothetical protein